MPEYFVITFRRNSLEEKMACTVPSVRVEVSLDTHQQTREKVLAIVDALLRENGAIECGIMGAFSLALGEKSSRELGTLPGPELKRLGVTSLKTTATH
jgi:hypothetical protein